jgi:hypothetical protein
METTEELEPCEVTSFNSRNPTKHDEEWGEKSKTDE